MHGLVKAITVQKMGGAGLHAGPVCDLKRNPHIKRTPPPVIIIVPGQGGGQARTRGGGGSRGADDPPPTHNYNYHAYVPPAHRTSTNLDLIEWKN